MTPEKLYDIICCGETSQVQFKQKFTSQKQIAEELVAFANCEGGIILFGIEDKTGKIVGLSYDDIQIASRDVGNTANEHVRPTIYIQTSVVTLEGKKILVANVLRGKNKPYKDLAGNIWVKQGADKRRITENREILSLFQDAGEFYPDELGIDGTSFDDLDTKALDSFFENVYHKAIKDFKVPQDVLLKNIHITDSKGRLTAAGLLFFGEHPQWHKPVFVIKAVWFYGNSIAGTEYRDSRDIEGTIPEMFEQGMMWLKSCLRRTQNGQSFNSIGKLEIPETVLEELLQNALVHADLLKTAAIRLLVFDDRVEIINPGCVFGGHTLDEVKMGNSFARNPLMANFCAKTMTYRGLGSGIPRVLSEDSHVEFVDNKEGNQFTARVYRPVIEDEHGSMAVWQYAEKSAKHTGNGKKNPKEAAWQYGSMAVSLTDEETKQKLIEFCCEPKSLSEICEFLQLKDRYKVKKRYINPLLNTILAMTIPETPKSPYQKYVTIKNN